MKYPLVRGLVVSSLLLWLTACGGGGQSAGSSAAISSISSVSPACAPSTIAAGATSQCSATVMGSGDYSSAVVWSASGGTISSTGVLT